MYLRNKIRVISRSSNLAIKQVEELFALFPEVEYTIIPVLSFGDKHKEISLIENKISDFFTRELDNALITGEADIAVHSAKDLPYPMPDGLEVIALLNATDKTESLISRDNMKLSELQENPRIGTSSLNRKNELLKIRKNAQIVSIRGTMEERIELVDKGHVDAIITATCALKRLGLEHRISEILPFRSHPLQGHLAVVARRDRNDLKALFHRADIRQHYGTVHLVGFGPGDPELLTVKAVKLLKVADVIIYDDLINADYLKQFPAEKIYVGKRKGKHSYKQDAINQLLYEKAITGKSVVRLKGGDSLVFARGGEEVKYLQERLIKVEIIPGITSALAAAGYTKIPLTQRTVSSSVAFCTGHSESEIQVPTADTLVYYMSASNLHNIVKEILTSGKPEDTPIAIIRNISLPNQEVYISTLKEIRDSNKIFLSPIIAIIGDTIKQNHLVGRKRSKVLVTGTNADHYADFGEIVHTPLIEIIPLTSYEECDSILENIHHFDWIIFTSRHAVHYFFLRLEHIKKPAESIKKCKVASIGKTTSKKLYEYGIIPDVEASEEDSESLVNDFFRNDIKNKKILIPRSNIALHTLPEGLMKLNNVVTPLIIYKTVLPNNIKKVNLNDFEYIIFSSPSCVENFMSVYENIPSHLKIIVKGKPTAKKIEALGFTVFNFLNN